MAVDVAEVDALCSPSGSESIGESEKLSEDQETRLVLRAGDRGGPCCGVHRGSSRGRTKEGLPSSPTICCEALRGGVGPVLEGADSVVISRSKLFCLLRANSARRSDDL